MSGTYQQLTLVGNLGRDPEMRYLNNGTAVTNFSMATNRRWKDKDGEYVEETTWFRVSVFGGSAEWANKNLRTGSKVLVIGRLEADENGGPRIWEDRSGNARASFEVRAISVDGLSGTGRADEDAFDAPAVEDEDDIPF